SRLTDDDREKSSGNKAFELFMCVLHQGAGSVRNLESSRAPLCPFPIRGAVGGDHDTSGRRTSIIERAFSDALPVESFPNDRVMNQFTKNRQRLLGSEPLSLGNGVADTETETETLGEEDSHKGGLP